MKIPFLSKKEEQTAPMQPPPERDVEERKAVDQVDLISKFLEIHQAESSLSTDYVLSPANDNTEEFTRSMIKAAVNGRTIMEQASIKYLEHEKNVVRMQEERGALAAAWGKEEFARWKKEKLDKAQRDCAVAAKLGGTAYQLISAEPHMVSILRRNQKANPFAKGAFEGDKAMKDEAEGKESLDKLSNLLGKGGSK